MKKGGKKQVLGLIIVLLLLLILSIFIYSTKSTPQIISASVYPEKVMPGQAMLIEAEIKDGLLIKNAKASIETDDKPDVIRLALKDGTRRNGIYERGWIVHDTSAQKWYNITITATNIFGKTSSIIVPYQDPTQSHNASEIVGGTFTGNYSFAGGTLKSLNNNMATNNVISMYTALNLSNSGYTKLAGGVVDALKDETGVDTVTSANESYNNSKDLYSPVLADSIDQQQTSANDVYGIYDGTTGTTDKNAQSFQVSAGGITAASVSLYMYKTGNPTDNYVLRIETDNAGSPSGSLVDASATKAVVATSFSNGNWVNFAFPSTFSLSASTTYWIVLSRSGTYDGSNYAGMGVNTAGGYASGLFKYHTYGGAWTEPAGRDGTFKLYKSGGGATNNMSLVSNTMKAQTAPTQAKITLFEEDVNAITLNTDLKAYTSRDNGTTWTQITLTNEGNYTGNIRILSGTADISSQPSGTDMRWNVTTYNSKNLKIRGVGLNWE